MEKPYRIEHEKDLEDTRYRWHYRTGMTVKHMCSAKLKKNSPAERAHAKAAFLSSCGDSCVEIDLKG